MIWSNHDRGLGDRPVRPLESRGSHPPGGPPAKSPPIDWYDCGQYSAGGYLLPGIRKTVDFLAGPDEPPR